MTRAQLEYIVAAGIGSILIIFLLNAVLHARTAVRDDLRRTDVTNLKRGAEMYFNQHVFYPTPPSSAAAAPADGQVCTSSDDPASWLFGDTSVLLKEQHIDAIPHDVREGHGHIYRYCVTDFQSETTAGYYFEAQLEVEQPDAINHDFDETRNFDYRVLHENGRVLYRVCGGTETQCTPLS